MTSPSGSRRSHRRDRTPGAPPGWRWLLGAGCLLVVGGLGLLAWARTPPGQAALLRLGSDSMFEPVQAAIEAALRGALPGYASAATDQLPDLLLNHPTDHPTDHRADHPEDEATSFAWSLPAVGPGAVIRCRLVPVPAAVTFWEVQRQLATSLRPAGGRVLWGERLPPPAPRGRAPAGDGEQDLLRLDIGVPGRPTHTLLLYKEGTRPPTVHWGDIAATSAWSTLRSQDGRPTLALVIDDWGYFENDATRGLLDLKVPLTLSVLPGMPYSRRFALEATELALPGAGSAPGLDGVAASLRFGQTALRRERLASGCPVELRLGRSDGGLPARRHEVILHLPMEPEGYPEVNPGPGAILVGMSETEVATALQRALAALPTVTGVSNHMGSRATADHATMARVMHVLAREGLFFLDSLTTPRSVAGEEARRAGVPVLANRIFLDQAQPDADAIRTNLAILLRVAQKTGFAVGIGHPYAETLEVLRAELPRLQREGVRFVTLSELLALRARETGARAGA
jgi:polysaccharide deacetylase 2 family uncharacterized protein YibQ